MVIFCINYLIFCFRFHLHFTDNENIVIISNSGILPAYTHHICIYII